MNTAMKVGLGATPTKIGSGEKKAGYNVDAVLLKRTFFGISVVGLLLIFGVIFSQSMVARQALLVSVTLRCIPMHSGDAFLDCAVN